MSRLVGGMLLTARRSFIASHTAFLTRPQFLVGVDGARRDLATNVSLQEKKQASNKVRNMIKKAQTKPVLVRSNMTARELAEAMNKPTKLVYDCLRQLGLNWLTRRDSVPITNLNTIIDIVRLCGFRHQLPAGGETDFESLEAELLALNDCIDKRAKPGVKDLIKRPPVVTIMGHVDHGKTTLLDALRGSNSVEKEYGGITQHIGAFNVRLSASSSSPNSRPEDRNITFLDTPGHAAFNSMRSRGARLTDIVVLVVAAEDSIMAQTVESIEHARASECPIIVAINKCDKATPAQIERVKKDLLQHGLVPEEMGGEVQVVPISALQRTNLDRLKEEIWAQAEVMELRGERGGRQTLAEGYVIESTQDTYKGKLATVLVTRGMLNKGDYLVAGSSWCKIKALSDENDSEMKDVSLSQAVRVMGWRGDHLPQPGDEVIQVNSENKAKELVALRQRIETVRKQKADAEEIKKKREEHEKQYHDKLVEKRATGSKRPVTAISIDQVVKKLAEQRLKTESDPTNINSNCDLENLAPKTLSVIIKTDVNGSLEAILNVLETYDRHDQVRIDLTHFDVGPVKKSDLDLAAAFNSVIYCFNLPTNQALEEVSLEDNKSYKIKHFNVIYKLFDDMKGELNERAPLVDQEEVVGEATVFQPFTYDEPNGQTIIVAGARCMEGLVEKKSMFKVERNGQIIASGLTCRSLKHFKNDINTAKKNTEFGLSFSDQSVRVEKGDKIVCYAVRKVKRPVEWNLGF